MNLKCEFIHSNILLKLIVFVKLKYKIKNNTLVLKH